jgi:hypothetical protein
LSGEAGKKGFVPSEWRASGLLWAVRSIYDLRRMPYGLRRCEHFYNSVVAPKANCEKKFPGRFPGNHSPVQSPNVLKYFSSEDRTISSTLSCFGEEVGRLLILTVAPVTLANASQCDEGRSTFGVRRMRARFLPPSSPNLFRSEIVLDLVLGFSQDCGGRR